eukprot:scaffold12251_cov56-Cyclotella_meneghiniana.AAC.1
MKNSFSSIHLLHLPTQKLKQARPIKYRMTQSALNPLETNLLSIIYLVTNLTADLLHVCRMNYVRCKDGEEIGYNYTSVPYVGKSDNDVYGLMRLVSYSCADDNLTDSEQELPVDIFILGPYPDQHCDFGKDCEEYDPSTLETELDDAALATLRKWREPDSKFMTGNLENRKRVLDGFKSHPFSMQMNSLPKQEVAAMWEKQIKENESVSEEH